MKLFQAALYVIRVYKQPGLHSPSMCRQTAHVPSIDKGIHINHRLSRYDVVPEMLLIIGISGKLIYFINN